MQTSPNEPLVTFNHRYEAIYKVAFGLSPSQQDNRTGPVEYIKKLPQNTRDKLLRKIAKKNSYIKTLDDAFKQAIEIRGVRLCMSKMSKMGKEHTHTFWLITSLILNGFSIRKKFWKAET